MSFDARWTATRVAPELGGDREPTNLSSGSDASMPNSPDEPTQRLLIGLLHGNGTLLQDLLLRK